MKKKILYSIGGIFVLFILRAVLVPRADPATVQHVAQMTQEAGAGESTAVSTTTPASAIGTIQGVGTQAKAQPTQPIPDFATASSSLYTYYSVLGVVDGDTIKIGMHGKAETLRLLGMDTPETVDPRKPVQCFGREASNKAKELLSGRKVRIEMDPSQGAQTVPRHPFRQWILPPIECGYSPHDASP